MINEVQLEELIVLEDPENNKKHVRLVSDIPDEKEDPDKYVELLREIDSLKSIIIDLHSTVVLQSDGVDRINEKVGLITDKVIDINNDISDMKDSQNSQRRYGYFRDYVLPLIGTIGVNYPIFWFMGPKAGILASTASYLICKLI